MAMVLYFSRPDENLIDGVLTEIVTGNTAVLAKKIVEKYPSCQQPIVSIKPYPKAYLAAVQQAEQEKQLALLPAFQKIPESWRKETIIFLGYPIWWGSMPRIVSHFLATADFSGKTIYPFCTHEGSGFGDSLTELRQLCPTAQIQLGLAVRGSRVAKADQAIANWLKQVQ